MTDETQNTENTNNSGQSEGSILADIDTNEEPAIDLSTGEKPEGLDAGFWDEDKKSVNIDALHKAYQEEAKRAKGLRDKLAKGVGKAPKDASEYVIEFGEKGKGLIKDDNDPVVGAAKTAAHKAGISVEQFNAFMAQMGDSLADIVGQAGAVTEEQRAEFEANQAARRDEEIKKIGSNGLAIAKAVKAWGEDLTNKGHLSESELGDFLDLAHTAGHIRVLNKLRVMATGRDTIPMEAQTDSLPSDREIGNMMQKAYNSGDQQQIAKVQELLSKRLEAGRPELLQI